MMTLKKMLKMEEMLVWKANKIHKFDIDIDTEDYSLLFEEEEEDKTNFIELSIEYDVIDYNLEPVTVERTYLFLVEEKATWYYVDLLQETMEKIKKEHDTWNGLTTEQKWQALGIEF